MELAPTLIETLSVRRAHRAIEHAIKQRAIVTLLGDAGCGKTVLLQDYCRRHAWPAPVYRVLSSVNFAKGYTRKDTAELFEAFGIAFDTIRLAEEFEGDWEREAIARIGKRALMEMTDEVRDARVERHELTRDKVYQLALARGGGDAVKVPMLLELGLITRDVSPLPLYIRHREGMSKQFFVGELVRQVSSGIPPGLTYRRMRLIDEAFEQLPFVLLFDEADRARNSVLHFLRELHDIHQTPIVLAGTPALRQRLAGDRDLTPLATRIAGEVAMGPPTLKEVQDALPDLGASVVARLWTRSGANFRLMAIMLSYFEQWRADNPRLKVTERVVDEIAYHVPGARHVHAPPLEEEERPVFPAEDLAGDIEAAAAPRARAARGRFRKRAAS